MCPPGFCATRECDYCLGGAFDDPDVDALARFIPTTISPVAPTDPPTDPPAEEQGASSSSGGSPLALNTDRHIFRMLRERNFS